MPEMSALNGYEIVDAKARQRLDTLGYVTTSALGLTPDDANNNNLELLANAINKGYAIYLDGSYTINIIETKNISKSVVIESVIGAYTLTFNKIGTYKCFNLTDGSANISIKNVNIATLNAVTDVCMFTTADILRSNYISAFECAFAGSVRFLEYVGADIEPTTENRLKLLSIEKCNISNEKMKFISLTNCPFDLISIKDNYVHNFTSTFAAFGNTNEYTYSSAIKEAQENIVCTNNTVVNDIDWFDNQTSYHCFLLAESKRLYYSGNTVEGLKSKIANAPVYDVYASADQVIYSNNVWKNNVSFDAILNYNSLVKIKGTTFVKAVNNKFILESDYIESIGADINKLVVNIYDTTLTNTIFFQDNIIDVACLSGVGFGSTIKKRVFTNNRIKIGQWNGFPFIASGCEETVFTNNTISIGTVNYDYFIHGNGQVFDILIFDNNNITIDTATKKIIFIYEVKANSGSMRNNKIKVKNSQSENLLLYTDSFNDFVFDNSLISNLCFKDGNVLAFISSDYISEQIINADTQTSISEIYNFADIVSAMERFGKSKIKYKVDCIIETLSKTLEDAFEFAIAKNTNTGLYEVTLTQSTGTKATVALEDPMRTETTWYTISTNGGVNIKMAIRAIGGISCLLLESNSNITENIMKMTKKVSTVAV